MTPTPRDADGLSPSQRRRQARDARTYELHTRGWSQVRIARAIGCSTMTVWSVLNGRSAPTEPPAPRALPPARTPKTARPDRSTPRADPFGGPVDGVIEEPKGFKPW